MRSASRSSARHELHHREDPYGREDAAGAAEGARHRGRVAHRPVRHPAPARGRHEGGGRGLGRAGESGRRAGAAAGGAGAAGPTAVSRQGQGAAAERADPSGLRPPVLLPQENTQIRDLRQENRGEPAAGGRVWRGAGIGVGGGGGGCRGGMSGGPRGRVGWRAGGTPGEMEGVLGRRAGGGWAVSGPGGSGSVLRSVGVAGCLRVEVTLGAGRLLGGGGLGTAGGGAAGAPALRCRGVVG